MQNKINYSKVIITDMAKYNRQEPDDIFNKHKKRVYCQLGEDGIIEYIFSIVEPKNKFYVEFGAWDGIHLSNTANLRINHGWTGVLFEGNKQRVDSTVNKNEINLFNEWITKDNINILFKKYNVPNEFDLLSIDVDGDDYHIWNALDFRPTLVIVETNPGIKNDIPLTIIEKRANIYTTQSNYFGANLHAFYNLAKLKGYELLTVNKWNAFFITTEEFPKFNVKPISKEMMLERYCVYEKYWADKNKYSCEPFEWINLENR